MSVIIYKLRCNRVILSRLEWWVNHLLNDYDEKCSIKDDLLRWDIWQRNYTSFELFIPCFIQKLDVCIFLMFCQVWWISFNQTVLRKFPLYNKNYTQLFVHFVQMAYLSNPMQIMTIAFWLQSTTVCSNPTLHDLRIILKWCNIVFLYLHHVNWVANIYDVCMRDGNSDKIVHEWKFHQTLNAIIFKTPRSF